MVNDNSSEKLEVPEQQNTTGVSVDLTPTDSLSSQNTSKTVEENQKNYSKWLATIEGKVNSLQEKVKSMDGFSEAIYGIQNAVKEAQGKVDKLNQESQQRTKENIEILGIFITFFTFISVSTSIILQLKTVFHAAFVLMVLLTGLMVFLYFFHHLLHHEHKPLEAIPYKKGECHFWTFMKFQWKTGNFCYIVPAIMAILCGIIAWGLGPETLKEKEPANTNYIQNMPTSKIRLDENIEQYNTSPTPTLPKPPIKSSVAK